MSPLRLFFVRVFRLDPQLLDTITRTDRMAATVNGDAKWMLTCRPDFEKPMIKCDDGNIYKQVK